MQRATRSREQRFDLKAARLTAQTPFAKVLTVVRQQPIAVLAYAGERAAYHLAAIEIRRRTGSDPNALAAGETSERYFFHRSSAQTICQSRVVHNLAAADVDSVVQIAAARCDKV